MDKSSGTFSKPSGIPRLSRLPVPRNAASLPAEPNSDTSRSVSSTGPSNGKTLTAKGNIQARTALTTQRFGNSVVGVTAAARPMRENSGHNALPPRISTKKTGPFEPIIKHNRESESSSSGKPDNLDNPPNHEVASATTRRRPRPSLSDRTIESLSQIPPSPSPRRRQSNFFQEASKDIISRPESSLGRPRSKTSHGHRPPLPVPTSRPGSPSKRQPGNQSSNMTPSRRSVSSYAPRSVPHLQNKPAIPSDATPTKVRPSSPSKAVRTRPPKSLGKPASTVSSKSPPLASRPQTELPPALESSADLSHFPAPRDLILPPQESTPFRGPRNAPMEQHTPKSSAALRETIAKAKAAQRNAAMSQGKTTLETGFEILAETGPSTLRKRIKMALDDGKLILAALGLKKVPEEVLKMYDFGSLESVDVTKINAADNELETIEDEFFQDVDTDEALREDEDFPGLLFGSLETLDVHGNKLIALPKGLRRLDHLTTVNLSKNRLTITNLDILAEVLFLRELRLAENSLQGSFPTSLCNLHKLEILDLHDNGFTDIPEYIEELRSLRNLNISGNKLTSLPWRALSTMSSLTDLDASRNRLSGSLFPANVSTVTNLKTLSVASNSLQSLATATTFALPNVQTLDISLNRLKMLPNLADWTSLNTMSAANNQLSEIPEGMTALQGLRTVDLSNNGVRFVDQAVGGMGGLKALNLEGNPLRMGEKRLLGMSTEDLKAELRARSGATKREDE